MATINFTVADEADLNTALSEIDLGGTDAAPATTYTIMLTANIDEKMPAESCLDAGGRHAFENAGPAVQLHPDFTPDESRVAMVWRNFACAPLLGDGSQLQRVRQKLALQASLIDSIRQDRARRTGTAT